MSSIYGMLLTHNTDKKTLEYDGVALEKVDKFC